LPGRSDPGLLQEGREHSAVGEPNPHVGGSQAEGPHDIDRQRDDLGVAERTRFADQVAVELKVLAQPAALLALIPEELRNREPADRLLEPVGALRHHTRQRGGHLRPQRDGPPPLVRKGVELPDDLRAALVRVQLQGLQRRAVVFLEGVAPGHPAHRLEDVGPEGELLGEKVPEAG